MRLMSWQMPQVSVKRCFIGPSGQSLAVYCACARLACASRASRTELVRDGTSLVGVLIAIGVLPERGVLRRLCLAFGGAWRKSGPSAIARAAAIAHCEYF